jgi:hypothetical protein
MELVSNSLPINHKKVSNLSRDSEGSEVSLDTRSTLKISVEMIMLEEMTLMLKRISSER